MSYIGKPLPRVAAGAESHCNFCMLSPTDAKLLTKTRLIFLDIDDVLYGDRAMSSSERDELTIAKFGNKQYSTLEHSIVAAHFFYSGSVKELMRLIKRIESAGKQAGIVLSSSWRKNGTTHEVCHQLLEVQPFSPYLIGRTITEGQFNSRGEEIQHWLSHHSVKHFAILDDYDDKISALFPQQFVKVRCYLQAPERVAAQKALRIKRHCNYCVLTPREVTRTEKKTCAVFLDMDETMVVRKDSQAIRNTLRLLDENNYPTVALRTRMAHGRHLNPQAVENLKHLINWIENKNMEPWIVISSDWRKDGTTDEVCHYMFVDFYPVGRTPSSFHKDPEFKREEQVFFSNRGEEIAFWLDKHRPDEYIIFDDSNFGIRALHGPRFIQVQELIQPQHVVQATKIIAQEVITQIQPFLMPEQKVRHCRFCIFPQDDAERSDRCYLFLDILRVLGFKYKEKVLLHYINTLTSHNIEVKIIITDPERTQHTTPIFIEQIRKAAPSLAPYIVGRTPSQEKDDPEMRDLHIPPKVFDSHYPDLSSKEEVQKNWNYNHGICFRIVNLDSKLSQLQFLDLHQLLINMHLPTKTLNANSLHGRPVTFVSLNSLFAEDGFLYCRLQTLQSRLEMEALSGTSPAVVLYFSNRSSREGYVIEPQDHCNLLWHPIGQFVEGSLYTDRSFYEETSVADWSKKHGIENFSIYN